MKNTSINYSENNKISLNWEVKNLNDGDKKDNDNYNNVNTFVENVNIPNNFQNIIHNSIIATYIPKGME